MIRERRSKEKLQMYYRRFVEHGSIDPNVHPWIAESWRRSCDLGIARDSLRPPVKLSKAELETRREKHKDAIEFLGGLYQSVRGYFNTYSLSLVLLDNECYALKSYALPFFQKSPGEVEGARLTEEDIGTSSIAIAFSHKTPFLVFGPEMWIEDGQAGDACSTPILLDGQVQYILTLVSAQQGELPSGALESFLMMMKHSMETSLGLKARLEAKHAILDAVPLAAYHILPGGKVAYANRLGQSRLGRERYKENELPDLNSAVLNYQHTPLFKGLHGVPSYNKEVTWITPDKTYEDITTVLPMYRDNSISGVVAISLAIEDLKMLEAYATGYTSRYSLSSMVGVSPALLAMKDRAARAARGDNHVLLQGEPGTGKQRLAHGIHQASARAAGPLITLKCDAANSDILEAELFGTNEGGESSPGKFTLAHGGTLFLDEVEKLPSVLADKLADQTMASGSRGKVSHDVRIIAASDGDLKRLAEKGKFSMKLFELFAKPVVRVPSLRMRREDIPVLAEHIIQELAEQHSMAIKPLGNGVGELLMDYEWPGNIKQLQTVIEHAFFHTEGTTITSDDIHLPDEAGSSSAWKDDRDVFVNMWNNARGNVSRLSNMLGVSRVTLYRYMRKYGLDKE